MNFGSYENPNNEKQSHQCSGIFLGGLFGFGYGMLPGVFPIFLFVATFESFLPGLDGVGSSTFGPMVFMVISILVALPIFPFVGGFYVKANTKKSKDKILWIGILMHFLISCFLLFAFFGTPKSPLNIDANFEPNPTQHAISPAASPELKGKTKPGPEKGSYTDVTSVSTQPTSTPIPLPTPTPDDGSLILFSEGMEFLLKDDDYPMARERFNEYIILKPNNPEGYFGRGRSYQYSKMFNRAIEDYDRTIALDNDHANGLVYMKRGESLAGLGKYKDAIKEYDRAQEINPNHIWVNHHKALAYLELRQFRDQIVYLERYIAMRISESAKWVDSEQAATAFYELGAAFSEIGDLQKAIAAFDKSLNARPNNTGAILGKQKVIERLK